MTRASAAANRLMTIPGVGQLTALAFVAALDDPRILRSTSAAPIMVPGRYQSRGRSITGSISKCGDGQVRTPAVRGRKRHADALQGPAQTLGLRDRQTIEDAQAVSLWLASPGDHHARDVETEPSSRRLDRRSPDRATASSSRTTQEGAGDGADVVHRPTTVGRLRFQPSRPQLTPSSAERARKNAEIPSASTPVKSLRP